MIEVKSTRLLFLYRSIIFKCIKFRTNDSKLDNIVMALNIKNKRKRIEYVYDEAICFINGYYTDDLCQFKNNQCIVQRIENSDSINGCCKKCSLVTNKGCPSSNLPCKLIYCKTALGNTKLLKFRNIDILKCLSLEQRIILRGAFLERKEDIIKKMNYGFLYSNFKFFI